MKKVAILTLGCKANLSESDKLKISALRAGYQLVELKDLPDICIINTCAVTSKSDCQSRQLIKKALRTNAKIVIVTGCYSEIYGEQIKEMSSRIIVVKNKEKDKICRIFGDSIKSDLLIYNRSRPFVKIQDGCNCSCSYCVIPKVRGKSQSKSVKDIVDEIQKIEEIGYPEVVLTGIHIGLYGIDIKPKTTLSKLLKIILNNTKKIRIRLSSLEPNEITDEIIELLTDSRLCKHLHIPLQSGDNKILKLMKRPYTTESYYKKVEILLDKIENISLGTDVIVGFPEEGEREFENTIAFISNIPFSYLHIFPYSDRPYTAASIMQGKISSEIKKKRAKILREIDMQKRNAYRKLQIGRLLNVVYEKEINNGLKLGKSENYLKVYFTCDECKYKKVVKIKILQIYKDGIYGTVIKK